MKTSLSSPWINARLGRLRMPPRYIATFDSATAMLLALARYLRGQDFPALGMLSYNPWPLVGLNRLSTGLRERLYTWGGWAESLSRVNSRRSGLRCWHNGSSVTIRSYPAKGSVISRSSCIWNFVMTRAERRLSEYLVHHHTERPHQGKGNVILFPSAQAEASSDSLIECRERLGGLLKYYYREAA
jgi:hypothetical protein